jgi:hypothetical protein
LANQSLCNPSVDAVKSLFLALESSFIYMPVNGDELVAAASVEFARTGISCPAEFFSAPIQYFVNSQLHYTANRAIAGRWPVEREVRYSANSKHTADVRIAVSADKHTDLHHEPFNIWIESDHARDTRVLYKTLQKVLVALGSRTDGHDIFVQFLYRNADFQKLNTLAAALRRSFDVVRTWATSRLMGRDVDDSVIARSLPRSQGEEPCECVQRDPNSRGRRRARERRLVGGK